MKISIIIAIGISMVFQLAFAIGILVVISIGIVNCHFYLAFQLEF